MTCRQVVLLKWIIIITLFSAALTFTLVDTMAGALAAIVILAIGTLLAVRQVQG